MAGMLLFINFITCRFIWLPQDDSHLGHSVWAPLLENFCYWTTKNLGTTRHISVNNAKSNVTYSVLFISFNTEIFAIGHWLRSTVLYSTVLCSAILILQWPLVSFNCTISPTVKFGVCFCHFCLGCRV